MRVKLTGKGMAMYALFICLIVIVLISFHVKISSAEKDLAIRGAEEANSGAEQSALHSPIGTYSPAQEVAQSTAQPFTEGADDEEKIQADADITIIFFDEDDARIKNSQYKKLNRFIENAKESTRAKIIIDGHAGMSSKPEEGKAISEVRAENVAKYMRYMGIPKERMEINFYGFTRFVNIGTYEQNQHLSMRVELSLEEE